MFLEPENDLLYYEMKYFLLTNEKTFAKSCSASYYGKLISYCRLKITNSVKEDFYRAELFTITKFFLEKGLYLDERFPSAETMYCSDLQS